MQKITRAGLISFLFWAVLLAGLPVKEATAAVLASRTADTVWARTSLEDYRANDNGFSPTTLQNPSSIALDVSGNLYIVDNVNNEANFSELNNRILRFSGASTTATDVWGQTSLYRGRSTFQVNATSFQYAESVAIDNSGNIYVSDRTAHRVLYFPAGSKTATRVYGQPDFTSSGFGNGLNKLLLPKGIVLDAAGNLYVADSGNDRVLYFANDGNTTADRVYANSAIGGRPLSAPNDVDIDPNGGIYVVDAGNNRVLHYPGTSTTADRVYGQTNFNGNLGSYGPDRLDQPSAVSADATGIYIADTYNNRVLYFANDGNRVADRVYGQIDYFEHTSSKLLVSNFKLLYPTDVLADAGGVYVADTYNNRVVYFVGADTTATRVYGQNGSFTTNYGGGLGKPSATNLHTPGKAVADAAGGTYTVDTRNNRVLYYPPNSTTATRVYGQGGSTNFTTAVTESFFGNVAYFEPDFLPPTTDSLLGPSNVLVDNNNGHIYITDSLNHRVLRYSGTSVIADKVYGQNDSFTIRSPGNSPTANTLYNPTGLARDAAGLYVADSYTGRVLYFADGSDTTADRVYGTGGSFTTSNSAFSCFLAVPSAAKLCNPGGLAVDAGGGLFVADGGNRRVLHYPANLTTPDRVYGQADFTSRSGTEVVGNAWCGDYNYVKQSIFDVATGNGGLYVTNCGDRKVLFYSGTSTTVSKTYGVVDNDLLNTYVPPNMIAGDTLLRTDFESVQHVWVAPNGGIYITDTGTHRVLYYPDANAPFPTRVFGQNDNFSSALPNNQGPTSATMYAPQSVAVAFTGDVYVADTANNRVLYFASSNPSSPLRVYGQGGSFTTAITNKGGISADSLSNPRGVAVDASDGLYVADTTNHRVLYYPSGSTTATRVYGQGGSFTTAIANKGGLSANSLNQPSAVALDFVGGLYIADTGNHRILYFPNPVVTTTATAVFGQSSMTVADKNARNAYPRAIALDQNRGIYYGSRIGQLNYDAFGGPSPLDDTSPLASSGYPDLFGLVADKTGFYAASSNLNTVSYFQNARAKSLYNISKPSTFSCNPTSPGRETLCNPAGLAVDNGYNLYVADSGSNRVVRFPADTRRENISWIDSKLITLTARGNGMSDAENNNQYIISPNGSKWFKFKAAAGSRITLKLSGVVSDSVLPANFDLTLHKDVEDTYTELISTTDRLETNLRAAPSQYLPSQYLPSQYLPSQYLPSQYLPSQYLPSQYLPSQYLPSQYLPSQYLPSQYLPSQYLPSQYLPGVNFNEPTAPRALLSDIAPHYLQNAPYSTAVEKSLIALSASQGIATENIVANTFGDNGYFYVQVRSFNGAISEDTPFRLEVRVENRICSAITDLSSSLLVGAPTPGNSFKTVLLTDMDKISGSAAEKNAMLAKLNVLAARPEVAGVVVDLADAKYQRVAAARTQTDSLPDCPYAKNVLAAEIKAVVDSYRPANAGLKYVVLAGSDSAIPFFRYSDKAGLAPESDFQLPLLSPGAADSALRANLYLGQDYYGAGRRATYNYSGYIIPLPDLAVGRLVETASEISNMIDAYTIADGVITPNSALVTGYDFVSDAAFSIKNELESAIGKPADTLIQPLGQGPSDPTAWSGNDLRAKLLSGNRHDMIFLAGHFSPGGTEAADAASGMAAFELLTNTVNLQNSLFFSVGCHSGYNIPLADNPLNAYTEEPDWAQVLARKGATSVLGTGYQYGDTDLLEFSERLYFEFSRQLHTRPTPGTGRSTVAVGDALKRAKEIYLSETEPVNGMHQKVLVQATLYGLPMFSVNLNGRNPVTSTSVVGTPTTVTTGPGAGNLATFDYSYTSTLTARSKTITNSLSNQPIQAGYFEGANGISLNNLDPVLPLELKNVSSPNRILYGVGFRGGTFTDQTNYFPLTASPATEYGRSRGTFGSPNFYPTRLWNINYGGALSDGAIRLMLNPAQYRSAAQGSPTGTSRKYNTMNLRLYYVNAAGNAIVDSAPSIKATSAIVTGTTITFNALVDAGLTTGVQEAWITYYWEGDTNGSWQSVNLTPNSEGVYSGTLAIPGGRNYQNLRYIVQAASGIGQVGISTNNGAYYTVRPLPGTPPPAVPLTTTITIFDTMPSSVAYESTPVIRGNLQRYNITNSNYVNLPNETVRLEIGSQLVNVTTDASGIFAVNTGGNSPVITVQQFPAANYPVKISYGGSALYAPTATATGFFTITKATTSLTIVTPGVGSVQYSDDTKLVVEFRNGTNPLALKPVIFVGVRGGVPYTATVQTDYTGRAALGTPAWPSGTYNVTAYFIPPGTSDDFVYNSSSVAAPTPLTITPENATVLWVQGGVVGQNLPQVSATIGQENDGQPGNLELANVRFVVKNGSAVITTVNVAPGGNGKAMAQLSGVPVGSYTLEVSVNNGYFSGAVVGSVPITVVAQNCAIVTQTTDSGGNGTCGTLSGAITYANNRPAGSDPVVIDLSNVTFITLSGALPALNNPFSVPITLAGDCAGQMFAPQALLLRGGSYPGDGLLVASSNVTLRCIGLRNFAGYGIVVNAQNTTLETVRVEKTGNTALLVKPGGSVKLRGHNRFVQ
jgi:sugar lactone lactonase YvrE